MKRAWSIEDGYWHHCKECGTTYSDADGSCECIACSECEKIVEDEEALNEEGVCEACANSEGEE